MHKKKSVLIAIAIFLILQVAVALLYSTMLDRDRQDAGQRIAADVEQVSHLIKSDLVHRFNALQRLAQRWQAADGTPQSQFTLDARNYVADMPGFQAIEWVDESMHIRWVIPAEGNEAAQGLFLGASAPRHAALIQSTESNTVILSDPINLVQGGRGFLGFIPLKAQNSPTGHILAVFRFNQWINHLTDSINDSEIRKELGHIHLSMKMNNQPVYESNLHGDTATEEVARSSTFVFGNSNFTLTGSSTEQKLNQLRSRQPEIYAALASAFSALLALLAYSLIRSRRANELALHNLNELRQKKQDLAEAVTTANAANAAKSNFLATMSHEIRTPMNGILGTAQILSQSPLPTEQRQHVNTILSSGESLLVILNDILDMSKIEAGALALDLHDFNLGNLVSTVCAPFLNVASDRGIDLHTEIHLPEETVLHGDSTRLRQILWNLLSNALKFTKKGHVIIRVRRREGQEGHIEFELEDTGSGISKDKQRAIFEPFSQADNTITRKHGGTGLGLSIVVKLVDMMDGQITLNSEIGEGSRFQISLPLETVDQPETVVTTIRQHAADTLSDKKLKVMLVEDNPVNAMIGTTFLKKLGHQVFHAEDGEKAVQVFDDFKPDVILMDIHMPNMNGLTATRTIRKMHGGESLPIIAQTADAMDDHRREFVAAGMNDVIVKPFTYEQLATVIAHNYVSG